MENENDYLIEIFKYYLEYSKKCKELFDIQHKKVKLLNAELWKFKEAEIKLKEELQVSKKLSKKLPKKLPGKLVDNSYYNLVIDNIEDKLFYPHWDGNNISDKQKYLSFPCGKQWWNHHYSGGGLVVRDKDKNLYVKGISRWSFPKGECDLKQSKYKKVKGKWFKHIDPKSPFFNPETKIESQFDCALRETLEESGYNLKGIVTENSILKTINYMFYVVDLDLSKIKYKGPIDRSEIKDTGIYTKPGYQKNIPKHKRMIFNQVTNIVHRQLKI